MKKFNKRKIVIATMNDHKVSEIKALIGQEYNVLTQLDFSIPSVPETGRTFEENALIKAKKVANDTSLLTIADDSGLEVDILDGSPGIYSARFAGSNATDEKNNAKLIDQIEKFIDQEIKARFHSVIALIDPDSSKQKVFHGIWEGRIITQPKGKNGFGYDPLFYIDELRCTAAELSNKEKNKISHRAKAMTDLMKYLLS